MHGLLNLPREVRIKINENLLTVRGNIPLIAIEVTATNTPVSFVLVRDTQTFASNDEEVDDALEAYKVLNGTSKQLAAEASEDFHHTNKITIRVLHQNNVFYTATSVKLSAVIKFANISITAPRGSGYWPADDGGPDVSVKLITKLVKATESGLRELADGEALSKDRSAMVLATVAARQPGRILDEMLMKAFIYATEHFASHI